jgi:hypothetical protein
MILKFSSLLDNFHNLWIKMAISIMQISLNKLKFFEIKNI